MRSKGKARKVTKNELDVTEGAMYSSEQTSDNDTSSSTGGDVQETTDSLPQVHIPDDVAVPPQFELRESLLGNVGLGVFSLTDVAIGEKFGPFEGVERETVTYTEFACKLVDELGKVRGWIDASEPDTGDWMKYIRSTPDLEDQNMMAVQVDHKVFYKVVRPIATGDELLVMKDTVLSEKDECQLPEIEEKMYTCENCTELFTSKTALRDHELYSCPRKEYSDNEREKGSQAENSDEEMERTPSMASDDYANYNQFEQNQYDESREFKCDQCPKTFNWKANLIRHQCTHNSERQYSCENCSKVFTDPSNLQRHIRTQHHGARCHACPECGKTFATSSGLKQHTHIHSSIKPFTCEVCLKSYTQFSNLCRHKRMHIDCRTRLKCMGCGQVFSTVTSLNKHRRFCHGQQLLNSQLAAGVPLQQSLCGGHRILPGGHPMVGSLPSGSMHPASMAQMWNANIHLQQQALIQNSLLAEKGLPPQPFMLAYPPLSKSQPTSPTDNNLQKSLQPRLPPSTEEWLKHYTTPAPQPNIVSSDAKSKEDSPKKVKPSKSESDISDGSDISNVSTPASSELDSTSGSDLDSDSDEHVPRKAAKRALHNSSKSATKTSETVKEEQAKSRPILSPSEGSTAGAGSSEPIKAIASFADKYFGGPGGPMFMPHLPFPIIRPGMPIDPLWARSMFLNGHNAISLLSKQDIPFNLSQKSPESPREEKHSAEDQPLDLSFPIKKTEEKVTKPGEEPRKTHIFGNSKNNKISPINRLMSLPYPRPIIMDPIYRVNHLDGSSGPKYLRMDYTNEHGSRSSFSPIRKFEHYNGDSGLIKSGSSPPSQGYPFKHVIYQGPSNKMIVRGKDRYTCKYCGKLFPRSANLTRHLRTHTGEQPYSCKYCDRSFSISSNLQRHVRNIHNKEKPFKCPLCDRCFGQQTNLDRHLKKHENDKTEDGTVVGSELNGKEDSYFDEIKNFIGEMEDETNEDASSENGHQESVDLSLKVDDTHEADTSANDVDEMLIGSEEDKEPKEVDVNGMNNESEMDDCSDKEVSEQCTGENRSLEKVEPMESTAGQNDVVLNKKKEWLAKFEPESKKFGICSGNRELKPVSPTTSGTAIHPLPLVVSLRGPGETPYVSKHNHHQPATAV